MGTNLNFRDYNLFYEFLNKFTPTGFLGIDRSDPFIQEMEVMMKENNQFFYIADPIKMKILFTSNKSTQMIGVPPDELGFHHFMEITHPDDMQRLSLGRTLLIKAAQDIFIAKEGTALLTTNFKMRKTSGKYSNILTQNYLYYSDIPYKTVFFLKVHTNIDWCKKFKNGYHYYIGNDMSFFRYPDIEMLQLGIVFSKREFEIVKLVELGLSTEQIAEKLFLSPYTINTHRRNILNKSGKTQISEVIYELKERGIL